MTLVFIDTETTGTDSKTDRPVSMALFQIEKDQSNFRVLYHGLMDPCMDIPKGASDVHKITDEMVKGIFPDYVMAIHTVKMILSCLPNQVVLVGHNISQYDLPLLDSCLGFEYFTQFPMIDTLDIAFRLNPELPSKKLGDLLKAFDYPVPEGLHGAMTDCLVCKDIFFHYFYNYQYSLEQWVSYLEDPKPYKLFPFGKYRGNELKDIPEDYTRWMVKNISDPRPDLKETLKILTERL
jgi:DNA polymerase III epsilon subunit-like protein